MAPPPDIGTMWRSDYIEGIGRRGDSFVVMFDLSRLLSSEDVALLHAPGSHSARTRPGGGIAMRLTIRLKLALAFRCGDFAVRSMAVLGIASLASLDDTLEQIVHGPVQRLDLIQSIYADLLLQIRAEKNLLLADNAQDIAPTIRRNRYRANNCEQHREKWLTIATAAGKEEMRVIRYGRISSYLEFRRRVREMHPQGRTAEARSPSVTQGRPLTQEEMKQLDRLVRRNHEIVAEAQDDAATQYASARLWLIGGGRMSVY